MIAANAGSWDRLCVCFLDAALEALGCQDEVYLGVNLTFRGILRCCPRQLLGVENVGRGKSMALCELQESPSSVVCLSSAKSSYCSCPVLVCARSYKHFNRLELQVYPSWESLL